MPSKSPAQRRMMTAVANNPAFAAKVDIPQSVGQDFAAADAATPAAGMPQRAPKNPRNQFTYKHKHSPPLHKYGSNGK